MSGKPLYQTTPSEINAFFLFLEKVIRMITFSWVLVAVSPSDERESGQPWASRQEGREQQFPRKINIE